MDDTAIRGIAFAVAILPAFVVALYFLIAARVCIDNHKIWAGFGFGACAAFPAIVAARLFEILVGYSDGLVDASLSLAFFGAAIPEEVFKLIAVLCLVEGGKRSIPPNHVFALAVSTACGFAAFENVFYVVESTDWGTTAILRSISAVPGHAFVGAVMGFCCIKALGENGRAYWWFLALALPIALHGLYNAPLFALSHLSNEHNGAALDLEQLLVRVFIATVIIEGVLAHLCLHSVLRMRDPSQQTHENQSPMPRIIQSIHRIVQHPGWWTVLAAGCLLTSAALALGVAAGSENGNYLDLAAMRHMRQGYAAFAALHGLAFLGLALTVRRRAWTNRSKSIQARSE